MPRKPASRKKPVTDPLSKLADAIDTAAETVTDRPPEVDLGSAASGPAPDSLAHYVYTGSYLVTFGVVFPALMIARSISSNNPAAGGATGGARAAGAKARNSKESGAQ
jgi:hypothetical protein